MVCYQRRLLCVFALCVLTSGCRDQEKMVTLDMALIPSGPFPMGSMHESASEDQKPVHNVVLPNYYIAKRPVTNGEFEKFILDGGYQREDLWSKDGWEFIQTHRFSHHLALRNPLFSAPDQPVVGVSWYEADAYCRWIGGHLPTEAEWEKAARGNDGRLYPWGAEFDYSKLAYQCGNGIRTMPVGSYPVGASSYGVMDMAGNVWEWTADWYDAMFYSHSPVKDPRGPTEGEYRVLRGGSWGSTRIQMQSTYRYYDHPDHRAFNIGFRCVTDAR